MPYGSVVRDALFRDIDGDSELEIVAAAHGTDGGRNELALFEIDEVSTSLDIDGDGVPDECVAACADESALDCDSDGWTDGRSLVLEVPSSSRG